jgi:hypothetical protein
MIRRLAWFVMVIACTAVPSSFFVSLSASAPAGAEKTGESCFHIANGSGGFAPGSGLEVTNIGATSAVLKITYVKTLACPLPGYIRYFWSDHYYDDKKADDEILTTAYEGFPVYSTGGDYVTKEVTMTDIGTTTHRGVAYEVRPDTEVHVVVKLGYAGTTHLVRIGFHTPRDPAKNLSLRIDRVTRNSITVTPKMTASRFGVNQVGVDIKSASHDWTGAYEARKCDAGECDGLRAVTLSNDSRTITGRDIPRIEPNTTYTLRLSMRNYYSGQQYSDTFRVTTAK